MRHSPCCCWCCCPACMCCYMVTQVTRSRCHSSHTSWLHAHACAVLQRSAPLTLEQPVVGDDDEGVNSSLQSRHSHGGLQHHTHPPQQLTTDQQARKELVCWNMRWSRRTPWAISACGNPGWLSTVRGAHTCLLPATNAQERPRTLSPSWLPTWLLRCLPSKLKGVVTMPTVKMPISRAVLATTGAAPLPVPPPMPACKCTVSMRADAQQDQGRRCWAVNSAHTRQGPCCIHAPET